MFCVISIIVLCNKISKVVNNNTEIHTCNVLPHQDRGRERNSAFDESVWLHIQVTGVQPHGRYSLQHISLVVDSRVIAGLLWCSED